MTSKAAIELIVQMFTLAQAQLRMAEDDRELVVNWEAVGQQAERAARAERIDLTEVKRDPDTDGG